MTETATRFALRAYGLTVASDWPLTGAVPAGDGSAAPSTQVDLVDADTFAAAWKAEAERIFEPGFPDGRTRFTVDRSADQYQLWLEDYGRYLIASDGTWVGCERGSAPLEVQERFVFAQALPVAAVLHGHEVIHAGTVCGPAGAAAFLGVSGSGKTTVTAHLALRGAGFMTDDVLALEPRDADILAHPGPPFMAIRPEDAWMAGDDQVGRPVGASDKIHVERRVPDEPVPLRVLYYLARGDECVIAPLDDDVRRVILGQAFVPYLATPERLLRHLELGQLINDRVEQFRLQTPNGGLDDAALDVIEAHLRAQGVR
jgi:hypothetical protein